MEQLRTLSTYVSIHIHSIMNNSPHLQVSVGCGFARRKALQPRACRAETMRDMVALGKASGEAAVAA